MLECNNQMSVHACALTEKRAPEHCFCHLNDTQTLTMAICAMELAYNLVSCSFFFYCSLSRVDSLLFTVCIRVFVSSIMLINLTRLYLIRPPLCTYLENCFLINVLLVLLFFLFMYIYIFSSQELSGSRAVVVVIRFVAIVVLNFALKCFNINFNVSPLSLLPFVVFRLFNIYLSTVLR